MSLLHDPFDLIKTGQDMDNIKPFIAQNKIDEMVNIALAQHQLKVKVPVHHTPLWKFSGLAAVACMVLFMIFISPAPKTNSPDNRSATSLSASTNEADEFTELVMLDTLDRY